MQQACDWLKACTLAGNWIGAVLESLCPIVANRIMRMASEPSLAADQPGKGTTRDRSPIEARGLNLRWRAWSAASPLRGAAPAAGAAARSEASA